ncbi:MAG: VWA domain-containing protein [Planctomycetes bacterium]|nr:VWA domain-containing protein [Planctomycetota bacterium]
MSPLLLLAAVALGPAHGGNYTGPGEIVPPALAITPGGGELPTLPVAAPRASTRDLLAEFSAAGAKADARRAALDELALLDHALTLDEVKRIRHKIRPEWLAEWARCLGSCGPEALPELRHLLPYRDPLVQAEAVWALVIHDLEGGVAFAREVLKDANRPFEARVAALRALEQRQPMLGRVEAIRRLASARGPLYYEVLRVIRDQRALEQAAPQLITQVRDRRGRAQRETVETLRALTGYRAGTDHEQWRYLLVQHQLAGSEFRRPDAGEEPPLPEYLGIPITGERVVFLLDASGSMTGQLAEQTRWTRGQRAVEELLVTLASLPVTVGFEVLPYAAAVASTSKGRFVFPKPERLTELAEALRALTFQGGTDAHLALRTALERPGVEEIILLSDGVPSAGLETDPARLLEWVDRWNRWRNVRVSTIGLGAPVEARAFLAELAARNGGRCSLID